MQWFKPNRHQQHITNSNLKQSNYTTTQLNKISISSIAQTHTHTCILSLCVWCETPESERRTLTHNICNTKRNTRRTPHMFLTSSQAMMGFLCIGWKERSVVESFPVFRACFACVGGGGVVPWSCRNRFSASYTEKPRRYQKSGSRAFGSAKT